MSEDRAQCRPFHVLVATPVGVGGQGGIDRIMATLKAALEARGEDTLSVRFRATRGAGRAWLSPFVTLLFCLDMIASRLKGQLDLVHINLSQDGSTYRKFLVAACARLLGLPYVLHLHGAEYHKFWPRRGVLAFCIRTLFEGAARVVVLGSVWRDLIAERAPAAASRVVIIPNASLPPTRTHQPPKHQAHILFLGRIGERKGVPQLGEALHRMAGLANWKATIAGDGAVEAAREAARTYGISDRVDLPGWVGPETVAELLCTADILVLPSFAENLPVSVIEGMGAGLAVVTTPVGAVRDIIIDGQTGLLVQPGDVEGLAAALTRLVNDPSLREHLGAAAKAFHADHLHPTPFAEAMVRAWRAAAARPAPVHATPALLEQGSEP